MISLEEFIESMTLFMKKDVRSKINAS